MYITFTRGSLLFLTILLAATCIVARAALGAIGRENVLSGQEQRFVNQAWNLNETQIALGRLAERQAASAEVKAFSERMAVSGRLVDGVDVAASSTQATS